MYRRGGGGCAGGRRGGLSGGVGAGHGLQRLEYFVQHFQPFFLLPKPVIEARGCEGNGTNSQEAVKGLRSVEVGLRAAFRSLKRIPVRRESEPWAEGWRVGGEDGGGWSADLRREEGRRWGRRRQRLRNISIRNLIRVLSTYIYRG